MEFSRQCKRFLGCRVLSTGHFKRKLSNISAVSVLRTVDKKSNNSIVYRIIIAENDEKSILMLNESDGEIVKELKNSNIVSYGICCTNKPNGNNFIYVSDHSHNLVRKFDENLNELKTLKAKADMLQIKGPCGISINSQTEQLLVVDQKNSRVLGFDLKTDECVSEIKLFEEELSQAVKYLHEYPMDLSAKVRKEENLDAIKQRTKLEFWPFGLSAKGDRIYVTDWNRGVLCVYKNGLLERKIGGKKYFSRPRDILLDSVDSMLVTDLDRDTFYFLDNKGSLLFETKPPKSKHATKGEEKGIFGVCRFENSIVFASNMSIFICNLIN